MDKQNKNMILRLTCVISSMMKHIKMIVFIMIISGMCFDVIKTINYHPLYASSMQVSFVTNTNSYNQLEETLSYIKTLDYVFNGQSVQEYIKKELNMSSLDMDVSLNSIDQSNVVNVQVVSSKKSQAYHALLKLSTWYQANQTKYHFLWDMHVLDKPMIQEYPINRNSHYINFMTGFFMSGVLSLFIVGVYAYFQSTVKTPSDVENYLDCRLFAKIPKEIKPRSKTFWKKNKKAILITSLKTSFAYKESFKKLRSQFEKSALKHHYQTIMVTGSLENEGKSSIAINLALSLVQKDYKVLVIDGDIRKPSLHKIFNLNTNKSLNHYLLNDVSYLSQIDYLSKYNLYLMCTNPDIEKAEELCQSPKIKKLMEDVKKDFDFIIIDSSPAYLNDSLYLNEYVDASLLVVRQNHARITVINDIIHRLTKVNMNLMGIVYNGSVIDFMKEKKTYGYRYGYNRYNKRRS